MLGLYWHITPCYYPLRVLAGRQSYRRWRGRQLCLQLAHFCLVLSSKAAYLEAAFYALNTYFIGHGAGLLVFFSHFSLSID